MRSLFVLAVLVAAGIYACGGDSSTTGGDDTAGNTDGGGTSDDDSGGNNTSTGNDSGGTSGNKDSGGNQGTDSGNTDVEGGSGTDSGTILDGGGADALATCLKTVTSPGSGHHNPGDDCLTCHDGKGAAPHWYVAGTVYSAATAGKAVVGATVEVIDANNQKLELHTYTNGNFYTSTAVKFPLTVRATACPIDNHMPTQPATGSCNTTGCHDAKMRIHIP